MSVIVGQVGDRNDPVLVALRTLDAASKPMQIDGIEHQVSASIGITLCPQDGENAEALLKNADLAMYEAKAAGRNGYKSEEYTSELQSLMRISYAVFCLKKKNNKHSEIPPKNTYNI